MPTAIARALLQLGDARILAVLGTSVLLSIGCFVAAWFGIDLVLVHWLGGTHAQGWFTLLGGLATLGLAWLLFPPVSSAFVALFLERVAAAVEARHYPELPPAPGLPWSQALACSLRFLLLVLGVNALLLVLLLVPPAYAVGYFVANGWLLGREYFELVAWRRASPDLARRLHREHAFELWLSGVALTFLFTLPVVNLLAPVLATAVMVHRFEAWRGRAAADAA